MAQAPSPGLQEHVGLITQAVVASHSAQFQGLDRERIFESARNLGVIEFSGTAEPIEAKN